MHETIQPVSERHLAVTLGLSLRTPQGGRTRVSGITFRNYGRVDMRMRICYKRTCALQNRNFATSRHHA